MDIGEGERCQVIASVSRELYHGQVITVTADIRKLPVFTGFSDQILRGRRIVIELDDGAELVPGEQAPLAMCQPRGVELRLLSVGAVRRDPTSLPCCPQPRPVRWIRLVVLLL